MKKSLTGPEADPAKFADQHLRLILLTYKLGRAADRIQKITSGAYAENITRCREPSVLNHLVKDLD